MSGTRRKSSRRAEPKEKLNVKITLRPPRAKRDLASLPFPVRKRPFRTQAIVFTNLMKRAQPWPAQKLGWVSYQERLFYIPPGKFKASEYIAYAE